MDRGAAEVLGLVLIAPVALALAFLVLWTGRRVDTRAQVGHAASAAAQSAARQRTPAEAAAAAQRTASAMLVDARACNGGPRVIVDTSTWGQGAVTVEVDCTPRRDDLPGVGTAVTISASATATLDAYRSAALP